MTLWRSGEYEVATDKSRLDVAVIYGYLTNAYWSTGRSRAVVERSIEHSLCFGLYHQTTQVGFARVVTDRATFAYLADVFVLEAHQGRGLGKRLVDCVLAHPDLQQLKRWLLVTVDAHGLYEPFGFSALAAPDTVMERRSRP